MNHTTVVYCPKKDKTVKLTADYKDATCPEDINQVYIKGRLISCSACLGSLCLNCVKYQDLKETLYR